MDIALAVRNIHHLSYQQCDSIMQYILDISGEVKNRVFVLIFINSKISCMYRF